MQHWTRIILPPRQSEALPRSAYFGLLRLVGQNHGIAAFRTIAPDNELYFSPAAEDFARQLGAVPCGTPAKVDVSLYCGDAEAWELCFPQP